MAVENYERGVKKPNQVEYISKEEYDSRVAIIKRAKKDIVWWAENFFHIVNMGTGLQLIKLYPKQKELLEFIRDNDRVITLASRQVGKSTTYQIFCLWYAMYFPEKQIMICSNKLQTSVGIVQKIAKAYELIPMFLKPGVTVYNKSEIGFANGSTIRGYATGSSTARSASANCVFIDEMAFIPQNICSEFFASVMPVISSAKNTKAVVISTANGRSNLYYELWKAANSKNAKDNKEGWKPFRIDWWETGGIRDEAWKQKQIATIGENRWRVEFGNEFLDSETEKKLIPEDIIEKYRMQISEHKNDVIYKGKDVPIVSKDSNKTYVFKMFKPWSPNRTYIGSSDCAEGIGKDSSVLYIWDITDTSNIEMVAKFSDNQVSILEFAFITHEILKLYGKPFIACECNGISLGYIEQLRVTYEYENFVRLNRDNGCGIQSHVQVKTKACLWFRDMMTTMGFGFTLRDLALIEEMGTFIKKDTKVHDVYAAVGDNHDDHIMTMIWMCWILNQENIDKYFIVTDYFTSSLGNQYPRNIQSLFEYSPQEIEEIRSMEQNKTFFDHIQNNIEAYREEELRLQGQNAETMKMLGAQTLVNDQMAERQESNRVVVYSQEEMMRNMRRHPQSSFQRDNDRSMIFGTGDKIYGIGGTQGGGWSMGGFTWEDEGRMW